MSDIERYGVIALTVLGLLLLGILLKDELPWADDPAVAQRAAEAGAGREVSAKPVVIPRRSSQVPAKRSAATLAPVSTPTPRVTTPRRRPTADDGVAAALATRRVAELDGVRDPFRVDEPPIAYSGENTAKTPARDEPRPAGAPRMHEIVAGDTLVALAKRYLGSAAKWKTFVDWNPGLDPERLEPGRKIIVSRHVGTPIEEPDAEAPAETGARPGTYEVQPGDTLSGIASRVMGSIKYTDALYDANRDILPSKNALKVGQTLKIPSDP